MAEYKSWSREQLIARIAELEVNAQNSEFTRIPQPYFRPKKSEPKPFDFSSYPQRKIALKFCYHGWHYNGLAAQTEPTPLPTVEEVLFKALCHARLVDRDASYEGCDWSRCGRTDLGVSSAGQVVALRIRSALGPRKPKPTNGEGEDDGKKPEALSATSAKEPSEAAPEEINYVQVLNRILPPTIRILAWSPVGDSFSARFNCRYRHYKYFFDSLPLPSPPLDIPLMQEAASRLVGTHDFRNYCKLDGSKQIERYDRSIISATISQINHPTRNNERPLYVFDLKGSAFLWHQVRHIMAILLLVGQKFEKVEIVDALLNANPNNLNPDPSIPVLETRPLYDMAEGLPLVLWNCAFDETDVQWRGADDISSESGYSTTSIQLLESMYSELSASIIKTTLQEHFLIAASQHHQPRRSNATSPVRLHRGGGRIQHINKYVPLLKRKRGASSAEVNENWRKRDGRAERIAARRAKGRTAITKNGDSENSPEVQYHVVP
jgi:tRNA pseudouridine38/39 synthase